MENTFSSYVARPDNFLNAEYALITKGVGTRSNGRCFGTFPLPFFGVGVPDLDLKYEYHVEYRGSIFLREPRSPKTTVKTTATVELVYRLSVVDNRDERSRAPGTRCGASSAPQGTASPAMRGPPAAIFFPARPLAYKPNNRKRKGAPPGGFYG